MSDILHPSVIQPAFEHHFIERIDSGGSDDSPFGSSLTTPVDENIQLFHGIEEKLYAKGNVGINATLGSAASLGEQDAVSTTPSLESLTKAALKSQESAQEFLEGTKLAFKSRIEHQAAVSLYNLPNDPIDIKDAQHYTIKRNSEESLSTETTGLLVDQISDPETSFIKSDVDLSTSRPSSEFIASLDSLVVGETDPLFFQLPKPILPTLLTTILQVVLFLPWCVAVGGAIVLFPFHLELVAFRLGYIKSSQGIRRFAHWADCGMQHVIIFFTFLAAIGWKFPSLGSLLIGAVSAQFLYAWQDFVMDENVPLGQDDRQTMYLVAKQYWLGGDALDITKNEDGYFISRLKKDHVILDDSDIE